MSAVVKDRWWKVVLRNGAVSSITLVSDEGVGTATVVYVRADTEEAAGQAAYNKYCRDKLKEQRAANERKGLCRCGRARSQRRSPNGDPLKRCDPCLALGRQYNLRCEARKAGKPIPAFSEPVVAGERKRDRKAEVRLEVLMEVQATWLAAPNIQRFGLWIREQIDGLLGGAKPGAPSRD